MAHGRRSVTLFGSVSCASDSLAYAPRLRARGFTLVEIFVSLLVIAAALALSAGLLFEGRKHQAEAYATTKAIFLADALLAEAETAAGVALPGEGALEETGRFAYAPARYEWQRRLQDVPEGTRRAVVEVRFAMPGESEPRTLQFAREFLP